MTQLNKLRSLFFQEISVETKKRRLLRAACITWLIISLILSIKSIYTGSFSTFQLGVNSVTFIVIISILLIDLKGHINLARYLITFALSLSILSSAFILLPGKNIEVFLIILGPFSVFFINRSWVQILIFSVSFGAFLFFPDLLGIHSDIQNIFNFKIVFVFFFFLMKDVDSVNRKSERSLQEQKRKAEKDKELIELQKQQLDELNDFKNRFFINIAHELRTPLTLINGFAEQLNKENSSKLTHGILNQSGKMKQIVDDILDLSKLHTDSLKLDKHPYEVNAVLTPIYQSFLYSFKSKGISFTLIESKEKIELNIDLLYFERALNNILLNALKFTENGRVTVTPFLNNNKMELIVEDTGIGIDPDQVKNIFTEFYQVDNDINRAGGSGVGLSFSKSIIELHDGTIEVESELGVGTLFKVILPAKVTVNETHKEKQLQPISTDLKVKKRDSTILVVEDHDEMRSYIVSLLSDFSVVEARNGLEALKVMGNNEVDLVITDYMMPKMDGYELIKELKRKNKNIPIIVLTARADTKAKLKMLRLGIDDYLIKPFHSEELLVRIDNSLNNNHERLSYLDEEEIINHSKGEKDGFVNKLSSFIEENCSDHDFNLEMLKDEFALSTSSLYRKVKSETGLSPIEFVKEVKLQKIRRILDSDSKVSIKSLALEVGISNTTYFKKLYFNRFGTIL